MNSKKFLCLLVSLILVFSCTSVFATNMTKADIVDYFDDNVSSNINVNTYVVGNFNNIVTAINSFITDFPEEFSSDYVLSNNYFCYYYNDDENYYDYYDLGDSKIISCDYSNYTFTLYLDNDVQEFKGYSEEGTCFETVHVNNIQVPINLPLPSNQFEDLFIYNSDNIFWTDTGGDSDLFSGILETMTFVLGSITTVMGALTQVDLILFVILASLTISIIYFVVKLLKGFTGNKLVNGKKRK